MVLIKSLPKEPVPPVIRIVFSLNIVSISLKTLMNHILTNKTLESCKKNVIGRENAGFTDIDTCGEKLELYLLP